MSFTCTEFLLQSRLPSDTSQGGRGTDRLGFDDTYYMDTVLIALDRKHLVEWKNRERGKKNNEQIN